MSKTNNLPDAAQSRGNIGKRITEFYHDLGLKRGQFAEIMDIKYETLRAYERGASEPGSVFFLKLKEIYPHVDIQYLITGKRAAPPEKIFPSGEMMKVRKIPVVHNIPASGFVEGFPDELIIDWTYTTNLKDSNMFALLVRGDSMMPDIRDGDFVIVTPTLDFESGKIYAVVAKDSAATLKKVYRNEEGYTLFPLNESHKKIFVKFEEMIKLYKLIEISRKF